MKYAIFLALTLVTHLATAASGPIHERFNGSWCNREGLSISYSNGDKIVYPANAVEFRFYYNQSSFRQTSAIKAHQPIADMGNDPLFRIEGGNLVDYKTIVGSIWDWAESGMGAGFSYTLASDNTRVSGKLNEDGSITFGKEYIGYPRDWILIGNLTRCKQ